MIYVFDLDGTLTIPSERMKRYCNIPPDQWVRPSTEDILAEKPNYSIVDIFACIRESFEVSIVTGRPEAVRDDTETWLADNWIYPDALFMRKDGDFRSDEEVKPELIAHLGKKVVIFEDRTCMVKRWRRLGYTCLQVGDGDY